MKIGILQTGIAADALITKHGDYPDNFKTFYKTVDLSLKYMK